MKTSLFEPIYSESPRMLTRTRIGRASASTSFTNPDRGLIPAFMLVLAPKIEVGPIHDVAWGPKETKGLFWILLTTNPVE